MKQQKHEHKNWKVKEENGKIRKKSIGETEECISVQGQQYHEIEKSRYNKRCGKLRVP